MTPGLEDIDNMLWNNLRDEKLAEPHGENVGLEQPEQRQDGN